MSFEGGRQYLLNIIQENARMRDTVIPNNERVLVEQTTVVEVKTDELEAMNGAMKKVVTNERRPRSSRSSRSSRKKSRR